MEFHAWLESKKIDPVAFSAGEPDCYKTWSEAFIHMHPASFTSRYLYQINQVRRKFILTPAAPAADAAPAKPRPVIRPK